VRGGIRARDACTLSEENSEGKGKRVGTDRGGDRGQSATRARHSRAARKKEKGVASALITAGGHA
jgi:hypothetical protein